MEGTISTPGGAAVLKDDTSRLGDCTWTRGSDDMYGLILLNVLRPLLRANSWLNWVDEDDDEDEVGLKEKPEDTRYIKKVTSK